LGSLEGSCKEKGELISGSSLEAAIILNSDDVLFLIIGVALAVGPYNLFVLALLKAASLLAS